MALFSARVAQHVLLTLVAVPLLAAGLPRQRPPPMASALVFASLFWVWHAPQPYAAALRSDAVYWAMHLSLTGSANQLTAFAAILTLSPEAWYGWHALKAAPYGLTALEDQQLAGALMWVAGGAVFLVLVGSLARRILAEPAPGAEPSPGPRRLGRG